MIVRKDNPLLIPILATQAVETDIRNMPSATWREVVAAVLEDSPSEVSLTYLYEKIEPHKKAQTNKWWKEKVRQTLQIYPNYFQRTERGMWRMKSKAA